MKCFHHNDADGILSGFIVSKFKPEAELISINYGDPFPLSIIKHNELVVITDYSISPEDMDLLLMITPNVIWIDHHKSAIRKYGETKVKGFRNPEYAACILTYLWFQYHQTAPIPVTIVNKSQVEILPLFVQLVGDYDAWRWEFGEKTWWFHLGLHAADINNPRLWEELWKDDEVFPFIEQGKYIANAKEVEAKNYCDSWGYRLNWKGYDCFFVNRGQANSRFFKSVKADIYVSYVHKEKEWTISLYSEKVDVSEIAVQYGGGGHAGAAGFISEDLPWMP